MRIQPKRQGQATRRRLLPWIEGLEDRVTPTTFKVNTVLDTVVADPKTGKDASGHISLRSAIQAANAHGGSDTITVPAGTFLLSIAGAGEDAGASGDLDITSAVTIKGTGTGTTIVDGNRLDRVFEILGGQVTIFNLTIRNGLVRGDVGGGLLNKGGNVSLSAVSLINNEADGVNGTNGVFGGSGGGASVGQGGGIFNAAGSVSLTNSTLSSNRAIGGSGGAGGGGLSVAGPAGPINGPGLNGAGGNGGAGDGADGQGGAIFNVSGARLSLSGTTIATNQAAGGGGGGAGGSGGAGTGGAGGLGIASPNILGIPGHGGNGTGGRGGNGGDAGRGEGGGLFNLGSVSLTGSSSTFANNVALGGLAGTGGNGGNALGGAGGIGTGDNGRTGGAGGSGTAGNGGLGGTGGNGKGGGIFNAPGGTFAATAGLTMTANAADSNRGGNGGIGGVGTGGRGGLGGPISTSADLATGGAAVGGRGGAGGFGGFGEGGAVFNDTGATFTLSAAKNAKNPAASVFASNIATGGNGGFGLSGGAATGGRGGDIDVSGPNSKGGNGGSAVAGQGGTGGSGIPGRGGALFNDGTVAFTGVTININANRATGGNASSGGNGGTAVGGRGGDGKLGGNGGDATSGSGGDGGVGLDGTGGGIFHDAGTLVIQPRKGARKGSSQSKATDVITANRAQGGSGAPGGGFGTSNEPGLGGTPNGSFGHFTGGNPGTAGASGVGDGGGLVILAPATIDNTTITGNTASTSNNDVDGTFSV